MGILGPTGGSSAGVASSDVGRGTRGRWRWPTAAARWPARSDFRSARALILCILAHATTLYHRMWHVALTVALWAPACR